MMTCEDVTASEIVEKYLLGQLSEDSRDSFEQHYFECARCFGLLQAYRQVQAELAQTRELALVEAPKGGWVWRWAWAPAMAVILIAVSVTLWLRPSSTPVEPSQPTVAPGPAPSPAPGPSLVQLARFEPPPFSPGRLRGAPDEATARFQEAMKAYVRKDYGAAVPGLAAAARLDPEAPPIHFYLGISRLITGDAVRAIESLRRTIALGDSPYREDAHFYLAKAYLQSGNVDDAVKELTATAALRGERAAEAERLLRELRAITPTQK